MKSEFSSIILMASTDKMTISDSEQLDGLQIFEAIRRTAPKQ